MDIFSSLKRQSDNKILDASIFAFVSKLSR